MFRGLRNSIFLFFWVGKTKGGPHKEVIINRTYETYGGHVYDLLWSIKKRGSKRSSKHLSLRANDWDVIDRIKYLEKNKLPDAIKEVLGEPDSVKKS